MATYTNEASLMASFLLHLSEALDDNDIVKKFQTIMSPLLTPVMDALNQDNATIDSLKNVWTKKDSKIATLEQNVWDMEIRLDDLEQGRRGSMRVFGVPDDTPGSVDSKVLALCNSQMDVSPPLVTEDIEVVHRLDKPPSGTVHADVPVPEAATPGSTPGSSPVDSEPLETTSVPAHEPQPPLASDRLTQPQPAPRPILVKFDSLRTKARVMKCKKKLKNNA